MAEIWMDGAQRETQNEHNAYCEEKRKLICCFFPCMFKVFHSKVVSKLKQYIYALSQLYCMWIHELLI